MSVAGIHAAAFYREVAVGRAVWTIRDEAGFPTSTNGSGEEAMPFWSSERRALNLISKSKGYSTFKPFRIEWESFCSNWVPGLTKDGLRIGLNWTGARATGYDSEPETVKANVEAVAALKSARGPSAKA